MHTVISDRQPDLENVLHPALSLPKNSQINNKIALSPREEECAYYTLLGCSAKEIAKKLNLSHRTIECYLSTLKLKLNCRKTSSLIVKMLQLGFLHQIPAHLLLEQLETE